MSPGWMIAVLAVGAVMNGYFAWAFREGKAPYVGPKRVSGPMRLTMINFGYVALPASICLLAATILVIVHGIEPGKTVVTRLLAVAGAAVILTTGMWMLKELVSPSRSRTPEWLRREK